MYCLRIGVGEIRALATRAEKPVTSAIGALIVKTRYKLYRASLYPGIAQLLVGLRGGELIDSGKNQKRGVGGVTKITPLPSGIKPQNLAASTAIIFTITCR
jgi:hypothetical protein